MPLIRIERRGSSRWYVRVRPLGPDGRVGDRRRCVGARKPPAAEVARIEAELYAAAAAEDRRPRSASLKATPGLMGEYLAWLSARRSAKHAETSGAFVRRAADVLGEDLSRWGARDVERWITEGRTATGWAVEFRRPWTPRTANAALQSVGAYLRWAVRAGHLAADPTAGLRRVREPEREPRWLDRREIVAALRACRAYDAARSRRGRWLERAVRLALGTGLRRGELASLAWSSVDLSADTIRIRPAKAKSRRGRTIPLTRLAREALLSTPADERSGPVVPQLVRDNAELRKALVRAGIADAGWHTLRHTYASHLVMRGVSITAVRELLGHSSISVTMIYAHLSKSHVAEAVRQTGL